MTGHIEAESSSHAARLIREMGRFPMSVTADAPGPADTSSGAGSFFAQHFVYPVWTGISIRHLALFYRQMAALLASGMTVTQALESVLRRQTGRLAQIAREMYDRALGGGTISSVMARYPRVFRSLDLALVRAGETSGLLDRMTEHLASYLEFEIEMRSRITRAVFYPCVLVAVFVSWQVLMAGIQGGIGAALSAAFGILVGTVLPVVLIVVLARLAFQSLRVRMAWDYFKILLPWIGATARKLAMSRFCRAFALLYSSGVLMNEALAASADAAGNLAIASRIRKAIPAIESGIGLSASMDATGALTPVVSAMIATGERTGSLDTVLHKAADYSDQEVDTTLHKAAILAFVLPLLIFAIVIGLTVVSSYGGLFGGILEAGG